MKADREAYWNKVTEELENTAERQDYRVLYQTIRSLSGKCKMMNDNIRKVDGSFVKSTAERLQRWKEYFNELYNHDPPQGPAAAPPIIDPPTVPMSDAEPTVEEVKLAIHSLKNNKAAGPDHVAAEALKAGGEVLVIRLHSLFKLIWTSNVIPANWKKAAVIPILKKGDNRECKNYRASAYCPSSARSL